MPILILLCVLPLALAAAAQYLACRFAKKRLVRALPAVLCLAAALAVLLARFFGWSAGDGPPAPLETLLFIPGLPAALAFLGLLIGWKLFQYRWKPRIINDRGGKP